MIETWWLPIVVMAFSASYCVQFTAAALRWRSCRAQNAEQIRHRFSVLSSSSRVARLTSQLGSADRGPNGINWRILEVADVVQESADCRSFYLVDPYGQELPDFFPGQYVMVRPAVAGAYQATRCYSVSSAPDARYWRITVKEQELAPDAPRGNSSGLSSWLHRTIDRGDCLFIGGPSGQFYLPPESTNNLVLLAAGVGITPMASMLRWSIEHTPERKVTLLYQVKDVEHWPLGEALHDWQVNFDVLDVHTFLSRETPEEIACLNEELPGHFHAGKIDSLLAQFATAPNTDFYMCGPDKWMEQIRDELSRCGVQNANVHWESFGSHSAPSTNDPKDYAAHAVRFELSDTTVHWQDAEQSLWELAKANQLEIPSGCLSGVCGSCRVKLISGQVEYDRQIGVELADGDCLTCVARPVSDLVLEA